jgi:hypothetical protein
LVYLLINMSDDEDEQLWVAMGGNSRWPAPQGRGIKARPKFNVTQVEVVESAIQVRVDDYNNPEFWLQLLLPLDKFSLVQQQQLFQELGSLIEKQAKALQAQAQASFQEAATAQEQKESMKE